jgi:sugar lactone lactonase YvrE
MKIRLLIAACFFVFAYTTKAQIISTVAGNGILGYSGDNGLATAAKLNYPENIAIDMAGNLYIADFSNNRIRKVSSNGIISTIAGNGTPGFSGDGGAATSAALWGPYGVTLDALGSLYIADRENNRIRKVNTTGIISTFAGNGTGVYGGDGGQATAADIQEPFGLAFDAIGNMYIVDNGNDCIRKVNTGGIITTVAGIGTSPGYTGDGIQATSSKLNSPAGLTIDSQGNLYIADNLNNRVRRVDTGGVITTIAGNGIEGYTGDGSFATSAELDSPMGVLFDATGNLYISCTTSNRIRKVNTNGIINTIAGNGTQSFSGDGSAATTASLNNPRGIAFDNAGNLFLADVNNGRIRLVSKTLVLSVNSATICPGNTTTLTASEATNYTWSPSTGLSTTSGNMVVANPTVTTSYTLTGTATDTILGNLTISTGIITAIVTVSTIPILNLTGNTYTICNGSSKTFSVSGASSYTWTPAITLNNPNLANPTASPTTTTIYTVTGNDACGISSPLTVTLAIKPLPSYTLSSNTYTVCSGSSKTFSVSGANTYTWTPSATLNNPNIANPVASPTTNTVYSVTGTNASGCINTTPITVNVSVNPLPAISISGDTNTCSSSTSTLTANGASTYTWSLNAGSAISNSVVVNPDTTTIYAVTGTNAITGCSAVYIDTFKISTCFVWPGDANEDIVVDNNDLLTLGLKYGQTGPARSTVTNIFNGYPCNNWSDTLANGFNTKYADCNGDGSINMDDTLAINNNIGTAHYLRFAAPKHKIIQSINPDIFLSFNKTGYLPGDTVKADVNIGSSANTQGNFYGAAFIIQYDESQVKIGTDQFWFANSSWVGTINQNTIKFNYLDFYGNVNASLVRINHTGINGYGKVASFQYVLKDTLSSNQLYFTITNATKVNHAGASTVLNTGTDSVAVVSGITGIKQVTGSNNQITVYPNPSNGNITITSTNKIDEIKITNMLGQVVVAPTPNPSKEGNVVIDISTLQSGVYFITTTVGKEIITQKIMVQP